MAASSLAAVAAAPAATRARALFDFEGNGKDELSFRAGDVIERVVSANDSWWTGELAGSAGVFPHNYVELLPPAADAEGDADVPGAGDGSAEQQPMDAQQSAAPAAAEETDAKAVTFAVFPLAALQSPPFPAEIDASRRELHLADDEFLNAMGCTKGAFEELPKWKRDAKKRQAQLF